MDRRATSINSFSVRCLFLWDARPEQRLAHLYEERITVWMADDIGQAIDLASKEANEYAADNGMQFLSFAQAYALVDPVQAAGVEVFSLLRESDLASAAYIDAFFCTGTEREHHS